ncbi:hypothetical protein AAHA92_14507 [Salvia divinorum]|uniref:Uncharacterized protein n=1 Tax=Salvia divinorum TaxID=28513 RepID=A0ABD1HBT2_SALDI
MAFGRRQVAVLLLLHFLVVSSTAVPVSRSLKRVKNQVLLGKFHAQNVREIENDEWVTVKLLERRMNIELDDYHVPRHRPPAKS